VIARLCEEAYNLSGGEATSASKAVVSAVEGRWAHLTHEIDDAETAIKQLYKDIKLVRSQDSNASLADGMSMLSQAVLRALKLYDTHTSSSKGENGPYSESTEN